MNSQILLFLLSFVLWGGNRQDVTDALTSFPPRKGSALQVLETARIEKNAKVAYNVIENKIKSFAAGNFKTSTVGASSAVNINPSPVKAMTAVAYRETRLLKAIAVENMETTELAEFWHRAFTSYPFLESHSTAWFELLDAHVLAGNMTGLLHWGEISVSRGGTLTPPLLKELLFSYAYNTTSNSTGGMQPQPQQPLKMLLPILSKLCNSRTTTPPPSPGAEFLWLPLPMSLLRKLAVDLLTQRRSADALAVLSCVHPLQWPYDALLTALATEGGASRIKACESILLQRQKLVVDVGRMRRGTPAVVGSGVGGHMVNNLESSMAVTAGVNMGVISSSSGGSSLNTAVDREGGSSIGLNPIRGSTARALLAMALQRPGPDPHHPPTPVISDVVEGYNSDGSGNGDVSGSGSGGNDSGGDMNHNGRADEGRMTDYRSDFVTTMNSIRTLVAKAVAQTASDCDDSTTSFSFRSSIVRTRPRIGFHYDRLNIHSTADADFGDLQRYDTRYQHTLSTHPINTPYQHTLLKQSVNTRPISLTLITIVPLLMTTVMMLSMTNSKLCCNRQSYPCPRSLKRTSSLVW